MRDDRAEDLTVVLARAAQGDDASRAILWRMAYSELHAIARSLRPGHAVDAARFPTATTIVHEAFMKCEGVGRAPQWENRAHFFGSAARAMGQFLIDWRRTATRQKRAPGRESRRPFGRSAVVPTARRRGPRAGGVDSADRRRDGVARARCAPDRACRMDAIHARAFA